MKLGLPLYTRVLSGVFFGGCVLYVLGFADPLDLFGAPRWFNLLAAALLALCAFVFGLRMFVSKEALRKAPRAFRLASYVSELVLFGVIAAALAWSALSPDGAPLASSIAAPEQEAQLSLAGLAVLSCGLFVATLLRAVRDLARTE